MPTNNQILHTQVYYGTVLIILLAVMFTLIMTYLIKWSKDASSYVVTLYRDRSASSCPDTCNCWCHISAAYPKGNKAEAEKDRIKQD